MKEELKKIPQVNKLLELDDFKNLNINNFELKKIINKELDAYRKKILKEEISFDYVQLINNIKNSIDQYNPYSLRRVINGTGTILHTNLGRALISKNAINNIINTCSSYTNLEFDLNTGQRGSRYDHLNESLADLLNVEATIVLNNNAAATMLSVAAFARDKEVIVSRGELVEIGGSFRVPSIIEASGAKMVEVGTTNRTHLKDYQNAITDETKMFLKVHPSNFHIEGFTKEVTNQELNELAKDKDILVVEDLGSGALLDFTKYGIPKETTVQETLKTGVDLVTFSGDKLLGGPQCGIIAGSKELIDIIKSNPLTRAFRVCKLTIAALEATLRDYLDNTNITTNNPTIKMLTMQKSEVKKICNKIKSKVDKYEVEIVSCQSTFGGGSQPTSKIDSYGLLIKCNKPELLHTKLRNYKIPIIGLKKQEGVLLDGRTIQVQDIPDIIGALNE